MMAAGWCGRIGGSTMPCESCAVQFSVFKRKRACCECDRYYCSGCLRRGGGMCAPCRILSTRPSRDTIASLKVRDLQCFLQRQNVSTRGCVEKEELVRLCESHVNSTSYRRRGQRAGASPFSSLKGFTNNINDFISSAFDLRNGPTSPQQAPSPPTRGFSSNCFNSAHAHASAPPPYNAPPTTTPPRPNPERFTTRPGGESDIYVCVPDGSTSVSRSSSDDNARVDTADCFEIEDVDDAGWEFVNRPADPLPNDSTEILMSVTTEGPRRSSGGPPRSSGGPPRSSGGPPRSSGGSPRWAPPARAASELELGALEEQADNTAESSSLHEVPLHHSPRTRFDTDNTSLQDDNTYKEHSSTHKQISVEQLRDSSELEQLNVKQLKELLSRARVDYRACLERDELLQRAQTLWRNTHRDKHDVENMPIEECCKICMAAPLECVLLECGHIAACTACSKQLAECPICRQYVVRAVRFFKS